MGGHTVPAVLAGPARSTVVPLYFELDGTFPNHEANPLEPENLRDLQAAVAEHGADLGLAFDGDADRCFVVDERGELVTPSTLTALIAVRELASEPGATVIHNLITSRAVPEIVREHGGTPVRTRVGHSFIKAEMAETGAVFGGEHSGHFYFRDFWRADSGMLAALHVLAALGEHARGHPLSSLLAAVRPLRRRPARSTPTVADPAGRDRRAVEAAFAGAEPASTLDDLDGLTVDAAGLVVQPARRRNTEPLLRLNVEARRRRRRWTPLRDERARDRPGGRADVTASTRCCSRSSPARASATRPSDPVDDAATQLVCTRLPRLAYPVRDGIPVMLLDEATPGPQGIGAADGVPGDRTVDEALLDDADALGARRPRPALLAPSRAPAPRSARRCAARWRPARHARVADDGRPRARRRRRARRLGASSATCSPRVAGPGCPVPVARRARGYAARLGRPARPRRRRVVSGGDRGDRSPSPPRPPGAAAGCSPSGRPGSPLAERRAAGPRRARPGPRRGGRSPRAEPVGARRPGAARRRRTRPGRPRRRDRPRRRSPTALDAVGRARRPAVRVVRQPGQGAGPRPRRQPSRSSWAPATWPASPRCRAACQLAENAQAPGGRRRAARGRPQPGRRRSTAVRRGAATARTTSFRDRVDGAHRRRAAAAAAARRRGAPAR